MTPRILLVADIEGWAFDNIARNIQANLGDTAQISVCYMGDFSGRPADFMARHVLPGDYDLIHFFWRDDLRGLIWPGHIHQTARQTETPVLDVIAALCAPAITTSVYDHLHATPEGLADRAGTLFFAHAYSVSSPILEGIYRDTAGLPPPDQMIPDGVRTDYFTPGAVPRVQGSGPLVVGWVGNSKWGAHSHTDAKGLHTILRPAIAGLQAEGLAIKGHFADVQDRKRSRDEMVEYYREIDVLVCASLIEGTPNPVLEAMAAGAAVVSTDVGIVRAALGPRQADFILPERSVAAMTDALRRLAGDPALLAALKAENRAQIIGWDWRRTTRGWPVLWQTALARRDDPRQSHFRRASLTDAVRRMAPIEPSGNGDAIATWTPPLHLRLRARLGAWIYARPRLARLVNRLRGRKP